MGIMTSLIRLCIKLQRSEVAKTRGFEDTRLRRHEVAIQMKGKLHTNYLARKEINETKFTTMNTGKLHNTY